MFRPCTTGEGHGCGSRVRVGWDDQMPFGWGTECERAARDPAVWAAPKADAHGAGAANTSSHARPWEVRESSVLKKPPNFEFDWM